MFGCYKCVFEWEFDCSDVINCYCKYISGGCNYGGMF